jgi:DNA-binding transcriptional ArsR family regulator
MVRKSMRSSLSSSSSPLADTNVLLDVLGNETRRRILDLISHEHMYFNQLDRDTNGSADRRYNITSFAT